MTINEAYDEWRAGKSDVPWSREAFAAGAAWQVRRLEVVERITNDVRQQVINGEPVVKADIDDILRAISQAKGEQ